MITFRQKGDFSKLDEVFLERAKENGGISETSISMAEPGSGPLLRLQRPVGLWKKRPQSWYYEITKQEGFL